jgi:hypothetical protein
MEFGMGYWYWCWRSEPLMQYILDRCKEIHDLCPAAVPLVIAAHNFRKTLTSGGFFLPKSRFMFRVDASLSSSFVLSSLGSGLQAVVLDRSSSLIAPVMSSLVVLVHSSHLNVAFASYIRVHIASLALLLINATFFFIVVINSLL